METARRALRLDWVWAIPARGNPWKAHTEMAPHSQRMAWAEAAFAGPRTRVSAIEAETGITYTIDLVRRLQRLAPTAHFVLLIGGDNLTALHRWRDWDKLARMVPICAISRPGDGAHAGLSPFALRFACARVAAADAATLPLSRPPAWTLLHAPLDPASSSELRRLRRARMEAAVG